MNAAESRPHPGLDAAIDLIETTASSVAVRVAETLGAAPPGTRGGERSDRLAAQLELRRNLGTLRRVFGDVLRERLRQETGRPDATRSKLAEADWQSLTLVDDHEVEERMSADRIGQMIEHEAQAELLELASYAGALLNLRHADPDRNPLRAEVLGAALYRAVEAVSERSESRKLLARELGAALASAMPACCARILADFQARDVRPLGLTVRGVEGPGNLLPGFNSGYANLHSTRGKPDDSALDADNGDFGIAGSTYRGSGQPASAYGGARGSTHPTLSTRSGPASTLDAAGSRTGRSAPHHDNAAHTDAELMALLRRLTELASRPGEFDSQPRHAGSSGSALQPSGHGGYGGPQTVASTRTGALHESANGPIAVNLIRTHREELLQASPGQLDHMVIDVVGSLFDQILSDSRVPPQMARQVARLQLPVLRVALNDVSFFSSRRHPVRRFVNRIASLACAFDDFADGPGRQLLVRVGELVQEIVDGNFDQIELYTAQLAELEVFIEAQTRVDAGRTGAVDTVDGKESELRIQQRYLLQLQGALATVSLPAYLREFLTQVWSQALVLATRRDGAASERAQRYRRAGGDLVMSVQPKGSPMLRKKFLMQLPPLMKDLNEGLQLIGWPQPAQRDFFAQLLPAHAESLKGTPLSELDYNMMAKRLEAVFAMPVPGIDALSSADAPPPIDDAMIARQFSPGEAEQIGFIAEAAVDWSGGVDIDLGTGAPADAANGAAPPPVEALDTLQWNDPTPIDLGVDIHLDVGGGEALEPTRGPRLIDHVKLGFAYQMQLKDAWQKVRLAHVSPGRSFFVFTRGSKHQHTISMTTRMLARMCESGRLRAVESAYLMERATQRARKQLAALKPTRL